MQIIGQPLLVVMTLEDTTVSLKFMMSGGKIAFLTEIRFNERSVVSNSFVGYWGREDRFTPHFNFQLGQRVSVFCVVSSEPYDLYFDEALFKHFPHRVAPIQVTHVSLNGPKSKIEAFRR